ncbi:glutamine synthetase [Anaerolineae bacterium CFX9]|jgi:glutamine synthetase|nr:glutamine synthetase [Anaerolineae bacterium CFX9]
MTKDQVLAAIEEHQIRFVALWFTDITGIVKSITIPSSRAANVIEDGIHFDGSSIEGFARVAESDMLLKPDLDTFVIFPWEAPEEKTARLICSVHTQEGEPFIGDPRNVLARVLREAADMGYTFKTGMELEFFLFRHPESGVTPLIPYDEASYFDISSDLAQGVRRRLISTLINLGIRVDSAHHEIGAGQYEIDFDYNAAMVSADQILTARVALRTVASQHQLHCTFMPRPSRSLPGSGMHTHQSLHDAASDENVFWDADHEYGLSEVARYFLAGQLAHARAMCAVLAPLVNSYKRLAVSFEAPKYITWAHVNRAGAALLRIPHISPGKESHTRLELRCPDPSANPYLASAVMLAAGLDGIRQRMTLPEPHEETLLRRDRSRLRQVETLPTSLEEAIDALSQDDVILAALGPYVSDRYLAAKRQELDDYNAQVTPWEVERYLFRY